MIGEGARSVILGPIYVSDANTHGLYGPWELIFAGVWLFVLMPLSIVLSGRHCFRKERAHDGHTPP